MLDKIIMVSSLEPATHGLACQFGVQQILSVSNDL